MSFPFVLENDASRAKLRRVANALSPEEMALVTPYGWTVAALFAHMAWWDQRMLVLLRRWEERGLDDSAVDSEAINESLKPLCHAIPFEAAVQLCLDAAEVADAALAAMSQDLHARIEASPNHFRFNRGLHRADHIHDILALVPRLTEA